MKKVSKIEINFHADATLENQLIILNRIKEYLINEVAVDAFYDVYDQALIPNYFGMYKVKIEYLNDVNRID